MATSITFNGANYSVPAYGDSGWAQGAGNLSSYLVAIAAGTLQTTGGTFTLSADANFGATFGLKAAYFKTRAASPSTTGLFRMALTDTVTWGVANNALGVSGTALQWNGADVLTGTVVAPVEHRYTFTAGTASGTYTGSLTLVNLAAAYVANGVNIKVFLNGLLTAVTTDYTETSTTSFTFTSPVSTGDRIDAYWTTY